MPWKTETVMDQRIEFLLAAKQSGEPLSRLCQRFAISRVTGYKWLRRYEACSSLMGLKEQSRRPHHSPNRTSPRLETRVLQVRDEKGWGAEKIEQVLNREGLFLPAITIHRILKRNGRISEKDSPSLPRKRFARERCNEMAQMDFKGEYLLNAGGKCYPLSFIDDCSRYLLGLWPLESTNGEGVYERLKEHFQQHGMPEEILTDHGVPWYSASNGHGLTRLSVWLIKQGVRLRYSGIGHPQTQGKVERFHRTLKERTRHRGIPLTIQEWRKWAEEFQREYNTERPHKALGMKTPVEVYRMENLRPYQQNPAEWEYGSGEIKRLDSKGMLYYGGGAYFVCEALSKERVRVDELEGKLVVTFRQISIREIDLQTGRSRAVLLPVCRSNKAKTKEGAEENCKPCPDRKVLTMS